MGNIPCTIDIVKCIEKFKLDTATSFYFCRKKYVNELKSEMEALRRFKDRVKGMLNVETPRTVHEEDFRHWMHKVEDLEEQVTGLLNSLEQRSCWLLSCYSLAIEVNEMLDSVRRLDGEKHRFGDIQFNQERIVKVPYHDTKLIGRDEALSEIVCHLEDVNTKMVGLFGMGGVGKTAILKKIKREMMKNKRHDFQSVVWITVSKDVNVTSIQNQITEQLHISLPPQGGSEEERQRAQTLHEALMNKRLLLLMDDIWEFLNLERVGIPIPTIDCDRIKIAFTTRDEQVCIDMSSQKRVWVKTLNEEDSLKLFRKVSDSEEILQDARFLNYAKQIVKKCDGLPLAIVTIGRAMANQKKIDDWANMISLLNDSFHKIHGVNNMLKILKLSFDKLENDALRSCLLYCCLYPEDCEIYIKDLINQWVAEGLVEIQSEGQDVINKLKSACLLESGGYSFDASVKMHDVVREMTLWLTNGSIDPDNYFKVYDTSTASNLHSYDGWDKAKRISLMRCELKNLPDSEVLDCPNLVTLLFNRNYNFYEFSTINFFKFMPLLCVLNLSNTELKEIPRSISSLVNLKFLNLSFTKIECLPMQVGNLKKLKTLNLMATSKLRRISQRAIIELVNLRALYLAYSRYGFELAHDVENQPRTWRPWYKQSQLMFKDLEKLKHLKDLSIDVQSESHFQILVNNPTLSAAITKVCLSNMDCNDDDLMSTFSKFLNLRDLTIWSSNLRKIQFFGTQPLLLRNLVLSSLSISSITVGDKEPAVATSSISVRKNINLTCLMQNLRDVHIQNCSMLKDVMWTAELPNLESLFLCQCDEMKTLVVGDDEAQEERATRTSNHEEDKEEHQNYYFPKLTILNLWYLQSLESISKSTFPLFFPSLKKLDVRKCPRLEDICLGGDSAKDMESIKGEQEWWNGLKWQDEDTKSIFLPYFKP